MSSDPSQVGVSGGPSRRACPHLSPCYHRILTHPAPFQPNCNTQPTHATLHETPMWREVETQPEMFQQKKKGTMVLSRLFWLEHFQLGSMHICSPLLSSAGCPSQLGSLRRHSLHQHTAVPYVIAHVLLTCRPPARREAQDVAGCPALGMKRSPKGFQQKRYLKTVS